MAPHIISWPANERSISPISTTPSSVVSIDSISSESSLSRATPPRFKSMNILGDREHSVHHANNDPFSHHDKYFFKDGNVTFLVDDTLYCVHRYFFSHHSTYFSTRLDQLGIREHEPLPVIISLGDVERKDFEAFLSVLYPDDFDEHSLSYEQWKSVLHLSTLWGFASLRKLAMRSINPPTPFDQLQLSRAYSVDHWILPALSALCERTVPLSLDEARQMKIEDVVLISTVREDIRHHTLHVDSDEIPRCIEVAQAGMHAVAAAAGHHGAFASEGARGEAPTKLSLSNGTDRSARSTTAVVANTNNNMCDGVGGGENEEDATTAVASSPVDLKRAPWGRDDAEGGGGFIASPVEARPSERERSSRPNSAWGKILVVPSPTVSHSPSSSTWGTADPPESHDPPPRAWPSGRVPSGWGSVRRSSLVLNTDKPVEGDPSYSDGEAAPSSGFFFVRQSEF